MIEKRKGDVKIFWNFHFLRKYNGVQKGKI
jgi:hypothetical protein